MNAMTWLRPFFSGEFARQGLLVLLPVFIRFLVRHIQAYGPELWGSLLVGILALILPPARLVGFLVGLIGIPVRAFLRRG